MTDYCNSLFTLLLGKDIKRLKSIQNRAARLVFNVGRTTPTTPLLCELHWLPIPQCIQFKLCLHIHKIITNSAPEYLSNCISLYNPPAALFILHKTQLDYKSRVQIIVFLPIVLE